MESFWVIPQQGQTQLFDDQDQHLPNRHLVVWREDLMMKIDVG
jgi:hypothetical protein